jgi:putative membrane protein
MKKNLVLLVTSIFITTSAAFCVGVQAESLSPEDQQFVKKAAAGGSAEVKLSELANDRGSDAKVKDFAKQMVTDHNKANEELKPIAEANKIPWPNRLEGESEIAYKQLAKLSGKKFDAEYIKVMVSDHDKTVRAFEEASSKVRNATLKAFIDKTLPVLRQHQEHIHALQQEAGTQKA